MGQGCSILQAKGTSLFYIWGVQTTILQTQNIYKKYTKTHT